MVRWLSSLALEPLYPFAFVVLERIPGTDLRHELASMTGTQMTVLAARIVDVQRRVASLELGAGFGWRPLGEVGAFSSWQAVVGRDLEAGIRRLETLRETKLITRIVDLGRSLEIYFSSVQPTCFLDDLTTKNVIVQNGELRGLVDFDVVCYGDPLYWLSTSCLSLTIERSNLNRPTGVRTTYLTRNSEVLRFLAERKNGVGRYLALTRAAVKVDVGPSGQPYLDMLEQFWAVDDFGRQVLGLYTVVHIMDFARFETDAQKLERLLGLIQIQATT